MGDDIDLFTDMRGSALDSPKYSYGIADYILRCRDHLAHHIPEVWRAANHCRANK